MVGSLLLFLSIDRPKKVDPEEAAAPEQAREQMTEALQRELRSGTEGKMPWQVDLYVFRVQHHDSRGIAKPGEAAAEDVNAITCQLQADNRLISVLAAVDARTRYLVRGAPGMERGEAFSTAWAEVTKTDPNAEDWSAVRLHPWPEHAA